MRRSSLLLALCASLCAGAAMAQAPGAPGAPAAPLMARPMDPAAMLLARTGELQLSDAQVVRLAAIARRSADRRRAMRASFDSMRPPMMGGAARPDSAARATFRARADAIRARMEQARNAQHTDLRDAIAVLTADQQARAWEMMAARRRGAMVGRMRRAPFGGMMRRGGPDGRFAPGAPGAPGAMMRRRGPGSPPSDLDGGPGAPRRPPAGDSTRDQ